VNHIFLWSFLPFFFFFLHKKLTQLGAWCIFSLFHRRRRSSLLSFSREPTRISSTPQQTRSSLLPKNSWAGNFLVIFALVLQVISSTIRKLIHPIIHFCVSSFCSVYIVEQVQQLEIDPDTLNFLAWSQSQIDDPNDFLCEFTLINQTRMFGLKTSLILWANLNYSNAHCLSFLSAFTSLTNKVSDLAPVASTSGPIAAQAFIKILSLASCDLIQVIEQDEAYGEVSNWDYNLQYYHLSAITIV
jgi:hypothetical protein